MCGERGVGWGGGGRGLCRRHMVIALLPSHPFFSFPHSSLPNSFTHFSCLLFPSLYLFFLTFPPTLCPPLFSLHSISLPSHPVFVAPILSHPYLLISLVPSHGLTHLFPPYTSPFLPIPLPFIYQWPLLPLKLSH